MMDDLDLIEPFARMLQSAVPPVAVRAVEQGGSTQAMWQEIAESGFLDALVAQDAGGAGLDGLCAHALWQQLGRNAVPLPVGETMIARALLAEAGAQLLDGPIALAVAAAGQSVLVPLGRVAQHVLVDDGAALHLVSAESAASEPTGVAGDLAARIRWSSFAGSVRIDRPQAGLRANAAVLRAALIAGAADHLVTVTAAYCNERVQFGKPIGRQQALQQNLAVMAEDAIAARIASQIGCAAGLNPALVAAATAKSVASAAAARIAATAHAMHGAIGISQDHDLQLFTRRLHEWRLADGSEGYWNGLLGAERLASAAASVDFVRQQGKLQVESVIPLSENAVVP